MKRICVFCGSATGNRNVYSDTARRLGELLVEHGFGLVFGGGHIGLMGVIADAVLAKGGEVVGVIPRALRDKELAHGRVNEMHIVETMHERKAKMAELSDSFVALPGGFGTCDELFEILTWRQLHIHDKPIGVLNTAGFFDHMIAWMDHMIGHGFVKGKNRNLLTIAETPEKMLELLKAGM